MPKKGKIRNINVSKEWKQWYIINKSKTYIVLSYHEFLFHIISLFILSIILCYLGKSLTDHDLPGPPKDHILLAPCLTEPHLTDRRYHFSLGNKQKLNINIAYFYLETLAYLNKKNWYETGGPITQTINHFSLNPNHWRSVENTWKTMISSLEKGLKYTVNNGTKRSGRP